MEFKQFDITKKDLTQREATAIGFLKAPKEVIEKIKEKKIQKGDPISCAEIAGISGAKMTSLILPLCHNIPIGSTSIEINIIEEEKIEVKAKVKSYSSTGVEMEALMATSIALLCLYDFCKTITQKMEIEKIHLLEKKGGKGGDFIWKKD